MAVGAGVFAGGAGVPVEAGAGVFGGGAGAGALLAVRFKRVTCPISLMTVSAAAKPPTVKVMVERGVADTVMLYSPEALVIAETTKEPSARASICVSSGAGEPSKDAKP